MNSAEDKENSVNGFLDEYNRWTTYGKILNRLEESGAGNDEVPSSATTRTDNCGVDDANIANVSLSDLLGYLRLLSTRDGEGGAARVRDAISARMTIAVTPSLPTLDEWIASKTEERSQEKMEFNNDQPSNVDHSMSAEQEETPAAPIHPKLESAKPSEDADDTVPISIFYIKDRKTGDATMFKLKKSTKMQKAFDAYARRRGVDPDSLCFLLNGGEIAASGNGKDDDITPATLMLEDGDTIECVPALELGGCLDHRFGGKKLLHRTTNH